MSARTLGVALGVLGAQLRDRPGRLFVSIFAIAVGVALAAAVHLVNASALAEFARAARELAGSADLVVEGTRTGFDESLYPRLAMTTGVAVASPVLAREAPLVAGGSLALEGVDPLVAAAIRPAVYGELAGAFVALQSPTALALSSRAARELGLAEGGHLAVRTASGVREFEVVRVLPESATTERIGYLDIANLQWLAAGLGNLSRIDLRLAPGVDPARFAAALSLPAGVHALTPRGEESRLAHLTRAYRINLDMLALVTLLTGAFLVYATQALAVMRRRRPLALLRALGVRAREVRLAVILEGGACGAIGGLAGALGGWLIARVVLARLGGDLGAGLLQSSTLTVSAPPSTLAAFVLLGTLVAVLGAWLPARAAAAVAPARALKAGDDEALARPASRAALALALAGLGVGAAFAPAVAGIPVGGYASIALLLAAGVLLVPAGVEAVLRRIPWPSSPQAGLVIARLQGAVAQSAVSLAAIVVSFSLMVAMATMVHSFRDSFERWLGEVLPADVYLRLAPGVDAWSLGPEARGLIEGVPGVARVELRRTLAVSLSAEEPPVTLIARPQGVEAAGLPTVARAPAADPRLPRALVSEAVRDVYGIGPGAVVAVPIGGRAVRFAVVGLWRDYARSTGSIVIDLADWERLSGTRRYSEGAVWLAPGADAEVVRGAIAARLDAGEALQVTTTGTLRTRALAAFDRAFAITYAIEAIAVGIGLLGVVLAFAVQALARRAEFGMLRHLGLRRREVLAMLAGEGAFMGGIGVLWGLALGLGLSVVLVHVVNRQSFHWTLAYRVPTVTLATVALALVAAAALTAALTARIATSDSVVRAVREDW
jgi:putative ABC transport system permease protein